MFIKSNAAIPKVDGIVLSEAGAFFGDSIFPAAKPEVKEGFFT